MKFLIVAGEASGDLHAAALIDAIKQQCDNAEFIFTGGDKMAAAAGCAPLVHYNEMAYMGFSEVLRNITTVARNLDKVKKAVDNERPDAVVLVDYPSFNLKVAAHAVRRGIPAYYYISPKIWAWKKWRVKSIRRLMRRVFCILPFEPEFYALHGYTADYVGNPSVAEIDSELASAPSREDFLKEHKLRDRPLIALMPGSRRGEIRNNLAVMRLAADTFPQYRPVVIAAPSMPDSIYEQYGAKGLPLLRGNHAASVLKHCRAALVTSGTATLETALAGVPQVVCYRANGSKLSYDLMKKVLDVNYVSLPNLILDRPAVPEMLLHMCSPVPVADALAPLLRIDSAERNAQLQAYDDLRQTLGTDNAALNTARLMLSDIQKLKQSSRQHN